MLALRTWRSALKTQPTRTMRCGKARAGGNEDGGEHCAGKGCLGLHCCVQDWGEEPLDADADPTTEGVMMEDPNYQEPEAAPQEGGASSSASPAKKAGNKGSSSSKGSPGVDGDEGARGDKQPAMLPTVYFLNLDEEKDMRSPSSASNLLTYP